MVPGIFFDTSTNVFMSRDTLSRILANTFNVCNAKEITFIPAVYNFSVDRPFHAVQTCTFGVKPVRVCKCWDQ